VNVVAFSCQQIPAKMTTWLTTAEMAKYLKVSERTLYSMRESHFKIGKHYRRSHPTSGRYVYDADACDKTLSNLCSTPLEV
tara:strand:+ start:236 stop:478 length:243 start_codon:yes stop_codon:yes gene_type:complete